MNYLAYAGTNSTRGSRGIYALKLDGETGSLSVLDAAPAQDSGYLAASADGKYLYAAVESMIFDGQATGGAAAYRLDERGVPRLLNRRPAAGQLTCHISTDGRYVFASSYLKGCVTVYPIAPDGSLEPACAVLQHEKTDGLDPHIHCAKMTPDGRYLCAVEVGYHALVLYDGVTFQKVFQLRTRPNRPRQVVFTRRFCYLITEQGKTVETFAYQPDSGQPLVFLEEQSALPDGYDQMCGAGGIRMSPDGSVLFASIRGADLITMFSVDPDSGRLTKRSITPVDGVFPRDFNLTPDGRYLVAGLQKSDRMSVYRVDYEQFRLEQVCGGVPVPSCSCVEFGKEGL